MRHVAAEVSGVNAVRRCVTGHQVGDCIEAGLAIASYVPVVGTAARVAMIAAQGERAARAGIAIRSAARVYGPSDRMLPPYRFHYPGPNGSPQHMDFGTRVTRVDLADGVNRYDAGDKWNQLSGGPAAFGNALIHLPGWAQVTVQVVSRVAGAIRPF